MTRVTAHPVVHLELRTGNLPRALAFYTRLFGWRAETVHIGSRRTWRWSSAPGCTAASSSTRRSARCGSPYVEVADIARVTERARQLGATVTVAPREGPAGWRSVVAAPAGATVAVWQPKA